MWDQQQIRLSRLGMGGLRIKQLNSPNQQQKEKKILKSGDSLKDS